MKARHRSREIQGHSMNTRAKGFTLIEMLIVVAIVAILAAIAYPAYQNYIMRTRRADGKELAMRIAATEERYFTNRNTYADLATLANSVNSTSEKGYYTADVEVGNAGQTYLLTLTPTPGTPQENDACGELTINNTGSKDWTGAKPPTNGACW
jgi:type IV pilus assembly protein PilE